MSQGCAACAPHIYLHGSVVEVVASAALAAPDKMQSQRSGWKCSRENSAEVLLLLLLGQVAFGLGRILEGDRFDPAGVRGQIG